MNIRKIIKEEATKKGMTLSVQEEIIILEGLLDKLRGFIKGEEEHKEVDRPSTLPLPRSWQLDQERARKTSSEIARAKARGRDISRKIPHASTFQEPEAKVTYGAIDLLLQRPELVRRIWSMKKTPGQQKDFFVAVLAKDPEALDYFQKGLNSILTTNEFFNKKDSDQVLQALLQVEDNIDLNPKYVNYFKAARSITERRK
jgi:hypothetical protein